MNWRPIRLHPGDDLRGALEVLVGPGSTTADVVIAGIGCLVGAQQASVLTGDHKITSLSGTFTAQGAHPHAGPSLAALWFPGNRVRTTAEILLVPIAGWQFTRATNPETGYSEQQVTPAPALPDGRAGLGSDREPPTRLKPATAVAHRGANPRGAACSAQRNIRQGCPPRLCALATPPTYGRAPSSMGRFRCNSGPGPVRSSCDAPFAGQPASAATAPGARPRNAAVRASWMGATPRIPNLTINGFRYQARRGV